MSRQIANDGISFAEESNDSNCNDTAVSEQIRLLTNRLDQLERCVASKSPTTKSPTRSRSMAHGSVRRGSNEEDTRSTDKVSVISIEYDDVQEVRNEERFIDDYSIESINPNARHPMRSYRWKNNLMTRRINADDDYKTLSEDTFTLMIMSEPGSKQWWYSLSIFLVQIAILSMILTDQFQLSYQNTPFDVPYKVPTVVLTGQIFAIVLSLATQTDLVIAIITFIMLWMRRRVYWTRLVKVVEHSSIWIWIFRIAMPLAFKFIEGVLVLATTFVIVIQSDSMIELFKDFAAMHLISELDNMMFWLALHGYAGIDLAEGAKNAKKVRIKDDVIKTICGIPLRTMVLFFLFIIMVSGWSYFVYGQLSMQFFHMKFPHCHISDEKIAFMADGVCNGGEQNSIACNFDDGDCLAFNIAYPGCRVVETYRIGNGQCEPEFNTVECGFDGGDCCPVMGDDWLGDGICHGGIFNTEICDWDEGDCKEFNDQHPDCPVGDIDYTMNELFSDFQQFRTDYILSDELNYYDDYTRTFYYYGVPSDGVCSGLSPYNIEECGYEGGDCEECNKQFDIEEYEEYGNGFCDGQSPLNIDICGYDGGDCYDCIVIWNITDPSKIGDNVCDGGEYMSQVCSVDGGDCEEFMDTYPQCWVEQPGKIGNGICEEDYYYYECGFDGGDCDTQIEAFKLPDCNVESIFKLGNGVCDGGDYATPGCLNDGGDCDACQASNPEFIGDGICDGVDYMNQECNYDGGDCESCITKDISLIGNGICEQEHYNEGCWFDGGDCFSFGGHGFRRSRQI